MKLTAALLLCASLQISAKGVAQRISISERNARLDKIFDLIEKQTGYTFIYTEAFLQKTKPVTIHFTNGTIEQVLDSCFKDQPFTYSILNKLVIIKEKPAMQVKSEVVHREGIEIRGKIHDASGQPVVGASVTVKGSSKGTVTNEHGNFTLNGVDSNAVLVISYVGYKTLEVPVNNRTSIDVALEVNQQAMNDIVIIGYGTQKKENLTGAVASVNSKELESRPLVNLAQGLQGLVPNLNVNLNSGKPGAAANFNIRGVTSLNSDNNNNGGPLVMVDGVQMDPNLINPADVENVTVLKDAASAAIYGSRGAYGVILITTRNGKKNSPLRINYSGSYAISHPTRLPKYLNSADYIAMHREADRTGQYSGGSTASFPFTEQDSIMAAKYLADPANNSSRYPDPANPSKYRYVGNTDWVDVLYHGWTPQQQHNVSVSGGSDKTYFIASMGYFDQKGMLKYSDEDYQRINPTLKISTDATSWLTLNMKATLNHIMDNAPTAPTNGNSNSYIQGDSRPNMPVMNPGGTDYAGQGSWTNPVAVMNQNGRDKLTANDMWLTGGVVLTPIKNVKLNADYTFNNYSGFEQKVQKQFSEYGVNHVFLDYYPWTYPDATTEGSTNNNYNALK